MNSFRQNPSTTSLRCGLHATYTHQGSARGGSLEGVYWGEGAAPVPLTDQPASVEQRKGNGLMETVIKKER